MKPHSSKLAFFRQSGWMVFATVVGGGLMFAVHKTAGKMDPAELGEKPEYGVFLTMLQVLTLMTIPSIGLQTIVMRQTVAALTDSLRRQLSRAIRSLLAGTLLAWLVAMVVVFFCRDWLMVSFKIANPATVWLTASWGLWVLWLPILVGLIQGRQNFLWMGWVSMAGGLVRVVAISVGVLWLGWQAAGACFGVLLATVAAAALAAWPTREIWLGPGEPVNWGDWWKRVLPLTLGPGVVTYMMSLDMIMVQHSDFPEGETGFYGAAGMIGRAMVFLTAPLTAVMFPKVAESAAKSEKSDAMLLALGATALIGAGAALGSTVLPSLPLRIVYDASYLKIAWLVPWFVWCMLPLSLGSLLVNNLLARGRYSVVVWLVILALGYAGALAWVCREYSSPFVTGSTFKNLPALAAKLHRGSDEVSKALWSQFTPEAKRLLTEESNSPQARQTAATELNRLIAGKPLHASSLLATNDFRDLPSFVAKLTTPAEPVARFLASQFTGDSRLLLAKAITSSGLPDSALLHKLNTLLQSNALYEAQCFGGIALSEETRRLLAAMYSIDFVCNFFAFSEETRRLLAQHPSGEGAIRLNRLLLEDAFPQEIVRSPTYDVQRFAEVPLSKTAQTLLLKRPTGKELVRLNLQLNRRLLEEAYPEDLVPVARGFLPVVQTLGIFGLLLVALALAFTFRHRGATDLRKSPLEAERSNS